MPPTAQSVQTSQLGPRAGDTSTVPPFGSSLLLIFSAASLQRSAGRPVSVGSLTGAAAAAGPRGASPSACVAFRCVCLYSVCVCFLERGSVSTPRASPPLRVKAPAEFAAFTPFESFTASRRGRLSVTLIYYPECIA